MKGPCLDSDTWVMFPELPQLSIASVLPPLWNLVSQITNIFSHGAQRKADAISKFSGYARSGVCS